MKKVKVLNKWGIFQNTDKEIVEFGFSVTVLHPDNMEYLSLCSPKDTDMEFDNLENAVNWIRNYDK